IHIYSRVGKDGTPFHSIFSYILVINKENSKKTVVNCLKHDQDIYIFCAKGVPFSPPHYILIYIIAIYAYTQHFLKQNTRVITTVIAPPRQDK
uniref:Uncharacterized protein n=1 Tax=Ciona intestinalis TaxID=7719 RepID=H2XVW2_CIOIN